MTFEFNNTDDVIDVRDVIERFEELETIVEEMDAALGAEAGPENHVGLRSEFQELQSLQSLLDDLKGNGGDEQWRGDWYPVTLIRDSYFEHAMDEMLEDCGDLPEDLPCYLEITVDYKALQMDYTSTEIDGVTYWYR